MSIGFSYTTKTWENFVNKMKDEMNKKIVGWNRHRELIMRDERKKRQVFLKEISKHNCDSPLNMIEYDYQKDNYESNLLVTQLRPIKDIFDIEKTTIYVVDQKEKMDLIKKIIEHYLNYIVNENFTAIMDHLNKLNLSEELLANSLSKVSSMKNNLYSIKEHYLSCSVKIAYKKQKMKNLKRINEFLKTNLNKWLTHLKNTEKDDESKNYAKLFKNLGKIQYDISTWNTSNTIAKNKNLSITNQLLTIIKNKMQIVKDNFDDVLHLIFFDNKISIDEVFILFSTVKTVQFQNPYEEFLNCLIKSFKFSILKIAKEETVNVLGNSTFDVISEKNSKFSIFKYVYLNENQLMTYITNSLKRFLILGNTFNYYMNTCQDSDEAKKIKKILFDKREIFFDTFEKKICKIIDILYNNIPNISNGFKKKNNFLLFLVEINIFSECIKQSFQLTTSKHISKFLHDMVSKQLKSNIKIQIKKTGIMLGGDNWKRIALQDNNEIFNQLRTNIPINYKKFLPAFNTEGKDYIKSYLKNNTKNNLQDLFHKIIDNPDMVIRTNTKQEVQILSSKLSNSKLILSTSSFGLIKSIIECKSDLVLYDSLCDEIYENIFNLFDYYILGGVNMFMIQKTYFAQIFKVVDIAETKKTNSLKTSVEFALFLESFIHIRKHFNETKKNLSQLFEGLKVDFLSQVTSAEDDSKQLYFPKINSQVPINNTNVFCLLIESIVLVESIISIYKFIKNIGDKENKIFEAKIKIYKAAIHELKIFLYKPLCGNIFRLEPIIRKMLNQKWELNEVDFLDASPFVPSLINEIFIKYEKLNLLSGGSLTHESQVRFFEAVLSFVIDNLFFSISLIKNSNSTGRSILLKDIKILKTKLEEKFNKDFKKINLEEYFNKLILYINSWYNKEDEMITYIKEEKVDYKYALSIIEYGNYFSTLSNKQKKEFMGKMDETYYEIIYQINSVLLN